VSGLPWFRLYSRMVDDEKLRLLAFEDRWHFVALCCLKSDGILDGKNDSLRARKIAVKMGLQVRELEEVGRRLREVDLVDENLNPVAWNNLQYRSDGSQERVKRYREARKARGLIAQWQPTKELRQTVYDRDGRACVYCAATTDLTLDHMTPEMHGGDHSLDNLQTACRQCNARKRDLTHGEYLERLTGNGHVTLLKRPKSKDTEEETEETPNGVSASGDALTPKEIVEDWNALATSCGLPIVRKLTPARIKAVRTRLRQYPEIEDWRRAFAHIRGSPFLLGENKTGWRADFDFLLQAKSFTKLTEEAYGTA